MNNPYLKKNPFMSLWLSGANRIAGAVRGQAAAEVKRTLNASVAQASEDNLKRWFAATNFAPLAVKGKAAHKPRKASRTPRR
jgi:hypothetical protein